MSLKEWLESEELHPEIQLQDPYGTLDNVREMNKEGKNVIFAPNHISPISLFRALIIAATDYPTLSRGLKNLGIETYPVRVCDRSMKIGEIKDTDTYIEKKRKKIKEFLYQTHSSLFNALGKLVAGGIGVKVNKEERYKAVEENYGTALELIAKLRTDKGNVVIYPYGKWFPSGEQDFSDETVFDTSQGKKRFVKMIRKNDIKKEDDKEYQRWRDALKKGFITLCKTNKVSYCSYIRRT